MLPTLELESVLEIVEFLQVLPLTKNEFKLFDRQMPTQHDALKDILRMLEGDKNEGFRQQRIRWHIVSMVTFPNGRPTIEGSVTK